ncbi:hypothetical protein Efla_004392 [Eimeria flavescens]
MAARGVKRSRQLKSMRKLSPLKKRHSTGTLHRSSEPAAVGVTQAVSRPQHVLLSASAPPSVAAANAAV